VDSRPALRALSVVVWGGIALLVGYAVITRLSPATTSPSAGPSTAPLAQAAAGETSTASPDPSASPDSTTAAASPASGAPSGTPGEPSTATAPHIDERVEYYDVSGTTASELKSSTDLMGPLKRAEDGTGRAAGNTVWNVRWRWQLQSSSAQKSCALTSFDTSVEIVMTLPHWAGRVAGTALADRWDRYLEALTTHERGHADNGIHAARAIQSEIAAFPPAPTCPQLGEAIKARATAILDAHRDQDREYDRLTQHGVTQGVVFPSDGP
jgi:predicted secreted Zn-dependent protease